MPTRHIDIAEVIDNAPIGRFQIRVFCLCALVALLDGFDAQSIAFVASAAAHDLAIPINAFGLIFGAGTIGLAVGALILPPFADRLGRRNQVILATFLFGVFSLATAWANSFATLAILRFVTGLGLGAAVPNMVPLVAEYSPKRLRAVLITVVTVSWPLGAVVGGAISAKLIPAAGWPAVFYLGGGTPILLGVVLFFALPESIRFLVSTGQHRERIADILHRVAPNLPVAAEDRFVLAETRLPGFPVRHLFSSNLVASTILLWIAFFMNFVVLFFMFNWLPPLMQQAGFSPQRAIIATVIYNLGGIVGGISLGRLMDRFGDYTVVGVAYLCGGLFVGMVGFLAGFPVLLSATVLLAGFCTVGTQVCGNALGAALYPTAIRSTGVGWAYGIGRLGSIVGPIAGGLLLAAQWNSRNLFLLAAGPLICAALAVFGLSWSSRGRPASADAVDVSGVALAAPDAVSRSG